MTNFASAPGGDDPGEPDEFYRLLTEHATDLLISSGYGGYSGLLDRVHRETRLERLRAADRRHDQAIQENVLLNLVLRSHACSSTCRGMRRLKRPPPSGKRSSGESVAIPKFCALVGAISGTTTGTIGSA